MYVPGARGRVASVRPQVTLVDVDAGVAEPEGRILIAGEPGLALTVVPGGETHLIDKFKSTYKTCRIMSPFLKSQIYENSPSVLVDAS